MVNYYVKNRLECGDRLSCYVKPKATYKQTHKQVFFVSTIFVLCLTSLHYIPYNALAQETTENFLTYTNTDYGFTIKYTSDWVVDDKNITTLGVKFMSPHTPAVELVVSIRNLNVSRMSLENMSKDIVTHPFPGFKFLEINTGTYFLSGYPAIRMVGIHTDTDIKKMILITNIRDKTYDVVYLSPQETYPNYLSVAQEMIDSFQAISSSSNAPSHTIGVNQSQINARLNGVVDFCMKSLPNGTQACDKQLKDVVTQVCANIGELDACHDEKVDQYYKARAAEASKSANIIR
jgi:hypothetical protein